jgi:hypothetical protein
MQQQHRRHLQIAKAVGLPAASRLAALHRSLTYAIPQVATAGPVEAFAPMLMDLAAQHSLHSKGDIVMLEL